MRLNDPNPDPIGRKPRWSALRGPDSPARTAAADQLASERAEFISIMHRLAYEIAAGHITDRREIVAINSAAGKLKSACWRPLYGHGEDDPQSARLRVLSRLRERWRR